VTPECDHLAELKKRKARKKPEIKWSDVEDRAKRIFGDRVLPNMVLLEREEE
jgi:hypothetical protein